MKGANAANYVDFVDFIKDESGKITGAVVFDSIGKKQMKIKCKTVVNCTGIHADDVRLKDDPSVPKRIVGARGSHLMLPKGLIPNNCGIIVP